MQKGLVLMPYFVYIVRVGYEAEKNAFEFVVDSHQALPESHFSHNPNEARGHLIDMSHSYLERLKRFAADNGD